MLVYHNFVYESKLTNDDIQRIKDNAKYFADAYCLTLAAIDFYEKILNGENKSVVVEFMHEISGGVRMYNDNVPGSITKYVQSEQMSLMEIGEVGIRQ